MSCHRRLCNLGAVDLIHRGRVNAWGDLTWTHSLTLEFEVTFPLREALSLENFSKLRHSRITVEMLDTSDKSHGRRLKTGVANLIQHRRKKTAAVPKAF